LLPSFAYGNPDAVVRQALAAVAHGRRVKVNGIVNAFGTVAARLLPRTLVTAVAGLIYRDSGAS
jgi:hypothetical protein